MNEILKCDNSNKSYRETLPCGAVYYALQGGSTFWVWIKALVSFLQIVLFTKYTTGIYSARDIEHFLFSCMSIARSTADQILLQFQAKWPLFSFISGIDYFAFHSASYFCNILVLEICSSFIEGVSCRRSARKTFKYLFLLEMINNWNSTK